MNKKWILAGMAALTAMSVLTGCGTQSKEAAARTDKPLIVGTEPSFPPFEMAENDTYTGFDIDLANAIGEKLGRKVEIKAMGFDALIPALKSGQIDIIASAMSATEERKKQVDFTAPYYIGGSVIVVQKDNTTIHGWDDITGKTVAVQAGSKPADFAEKQGAVPNSSTAITSACKNCKTVAVTPSQSTSRRLVLCFQRRHEQSESRRQNRRNWPVQLWPSTKAMKTN